MPFPFLIGGALLAAAGIGIKSGMDAKEKMDRAEEYNDDAEYYANKFEATKDHVEEIREELNDNLENIGRVKVEIADKMTTLREQLVEDTGISYTENEMPHLNEFCNSMASVVGASLASGALSGLGALGLAGLVGTASTGTAISSLAGVAATNATLAWIGGGSLAAGGLGIAGGTAILGGLVAAPILLVGGLMLDSKADEALSKARRNKKKAEQAYNEIKKAEDNCNQINAVASKELEILTTANEHLTSILSAQEEIDKDTTMTKTDKQHTTEALKEKIKPFLEALAELCKTPLLSDDGSIYQDINTNMKKVMATIAEMQ